MAHAKKPLLEIVGGPNGSGKSTFAESYLVRVMKRESYLNPDVITAGVSPSHSQRASFQAGRIFLGEVKERISRKEDLGFETTLAGLSYLKFLADAKDAGYFIRIYFLVTANSRINIERIKKRVEMGGHDIPTKDVLRRYKRSFVNFWSSYRPLADDWIVFDNSGPKPIYIQSKEALEKVPADDQYKFAKDFLKGKVRHEKKS